MLLQHFDTRSVTWIVGQHSGDHVFALRGQSLIHFGSVLIRACPLLVQHDVLVFLDLLEVIRELACNQKMPALDQTRAVVGKRILTIEHGEQHDSHCPDVDCKRVVLPAVHQFRRKVRLSAAPRLTQSFRRVHHADVTGKAEVRQFGVQVFIHEDVFDFDVPVTDAMVHVHTLQCISTLLEPELGFVLAQVSAVCFPDLVGQRAAARELHEDVNLLL